MRIIRHAYIYSELVGPNQTEHVVAHVGSLGCGFDRISRIIGSWYYRSITSILIDDDAEETRISPYETLQMIYLNEKKDNNSNLTVLTRANATISLPIVIY